jgi:hypothetical protein
VKGLARGGMIYRMEILILDTRNIDRSIDRSIDFSQLLTSKDVTTIKKLKRSYQP